MDNGIYNDIGGYMELNSYALPILHENAVALNCGRNCLRYLIRARKIKKIILPYFLCTTVREVCTEEQLSIRYYHMDESLRPEAVSLADEEWLYLVNYYGQFSTDEIQQYKKRYNRIIVDNAQAYFCMPEKNTDTIYTCRKFFGVPDGAFLYTDAELDEELERDESYKRMNFILGRYERPASEFYMEYVQNNELFDTEPMKKMSRLTKNLLRGIDYRMAEQRRTCNYTYLFERLKGVNQLQLRRIEGAFAYPLLIKNGDEIRRNLIRERVYIPTLWPNVLSDAESDSIEYRYAKDILPLPCDQRYADSEMQRICDLLNRFI